MENPTMPTIPTTALQNMEVVFPPLTLQDTGHVVNNSYFPVDNKGEKKPTLKCRVEIAPGVAVCGFLIQGELNKVFVQPDHERPEWNTWHLDVQDVPEPFIKVEVVGEPHHRKLTVVDHQYSYGWQRNKARTKDMLDSYDGTRWGAGIHRNRSHSHYESRQVPYIYLRVRVTHPDSGCVTEGEMRFERPRVGRVSIHDPGTDITLGNLDRTLSVRADFFGMEQAWDYDVYEWQDFRKLLQEYILTESKDEFWAWWFDEIRSPQSPDRAELASVKSLWKRKAIKPNLERLATDEPLLYRYLLWLHDKQNQDGTSNNKLIAAFLKQCGADYDALRDNLRASIDGAPEVKEYESKGYATAIQNRSLCLSFPGADERERVRREKKEWSFRKGVSAQADGLGLDATRHPKTLAAIESGDLPLSVFHEPGDKDHLINIEFDLWERAFSQPGWTDVLCACARNASRRGKYSKRITSYIAFLFKLPLYLDKHAPRMTPSGKRSKTGWKAMPKFVESQWELEMDEASEDGTTSKRSALTPVADNDTGVITVPYVAMAVHGAFTTWCYSDQYFVAEAGLNDPIGEGVFVDDLAVKLNGRDDYGLMFYTLMGTDRNTGYPSFLVIFERLPKRKDLKLSTRVHFHRVHPCRRRNGQPTPTCRLIEECYRYMAGNVRVEEIDTQQGDLIFIRRDKPGKAVESPIAVASFESHAFVPLTDGAPSVTVVRSVAKAPTNRMGYLYSEVDFTVQHPEHEDIPRLAAGWWEVRRCKSWEANPSAVWSLTID